MDSLIYVPSLSNVWILSSIAARHALQSSWKVTESNDNAEMSIADSLGFIICEGGSSSVSSIIFKKKLTTQSRKKIVFINTFFTLEITTAQGKMSKGSKQTEVNSVIILSLAIIVAASAVGILVGFVKCDTFGRMFGKVVFRVFVWIVSVWRT